MSVLCFYLCCLVSLVLLVSINGETYYRNVRDYGAKGDGQSDDTAAIISAITDGRGKDPNAKFPNTIYADSTVHACQVYFPAGTYKITNSLPLIYYTQLIGEANNLPTLKVVSSSSVSLRVLDALEQSWSTSVNQNNFYRSVRNFVVDMTECTNCVGSHWQVAQATSLINIYFKMGTGTQNQGIWMENGSGGYISDLTFDGGVFGLWVGNQQFTSRNITIKNAKTAIYLNWDWAWSFKSIHISDCAVGIDVAGAGSLIVMDSRFTNTPIAIRTTFTTSSATDSILIDNVVYESNNGGVVLANGGNTVLRGNAGSTTVKHYVQGHVWKDNANTIESLDISNVAPARPSALVDSNGMFFEKMRPEYPNVVDVTTLGLIADGNFDNTQPLQAALNKYANSEQALFFPHGIYIITNTIYIPPGSKLVGQAWSVLSARGSAFGDAKNPVVVLKVGNAGETGSCHLIDLLISTTGPVPGAVLLQWNLHDPQGQPGANGMWDTHFRVGGADSTLIRDSNCISGDGSNINTAACTGAHTLMHISQTGNLYMENVWGWVADHDIDNGPQINVYNGRGFLCESQGPVWMYGTAFEHSVLYQYNFNGAKNIFMTMIQTETPYYQPSTNTPFASLITERTDPTFCTGDARCNMALGLVINNSTDIFNYGSGLYSFFNVWAQTCLTASPNKQPTCQLELTKITNSKNIYQYSLNTYGSVYSLTQKETYSSAEANINTFCSTGIVNMNNWGTSSSNNAFAATY